MATASPPSIDETLGEVRFLIPRVDWDGYDALLRDVLKHRRSIRVTYDRGNVELMSPLYPHERYGYLLGRMIHAVTEELDIPMRGIRSTTLRRMDVDRGLEADEAYYITNSYRVGPSGHLDLETAPPPDLAIEIEITNSILDRLGVYAALGVPEIWRFDGEALIGLVLGADRLYHSRETSLAFPFLPLGELVRFIGEHVPGEDTAWAKSFRAWVRDVLLPIYRNQAAPE
jgi:Uma2 family endonuclease